MLSLPFHTQMLSRPLLLTMLSPAVNRSVLLLLPVIDYLRYLCLCQCSVVRCIMFSGCLWVCLAVCLSVCVVNTIYWKLLDIFSSNFLHWCILGLGWMLRFLGQKVKGQGHTAWPMVQWAEACRARNLMSEVLEMSLNFTSQLQWEPWPWEQAQWKGPSYP